MSIKLCRLCLNNESLLNVFDPNFIEGNTEQLRLCIRTCTGINIEEKDQITKYVCHLCANTVIKFYKYKNTVLANQDVLKEINEIQLSSKFTKQNKAEKCKKFAIHPSVKNLFKMYDTLVIPNEIFPIDIHPVIELIDCKNQLNVSQEDFGRQFNVSVDDSKNNLVRKHKRDMDDHDIVKKRKLSTESFMDNSENEQIVNNINDSVLSSDDSSKTLTDIELENNIQNVINVGIENQQSNAIISPEQSTIEGVIKENTSQSEQNAVPKKAMSNAETTEFRANNLLSDVSIENNESLAIETENVVTNEFASEKITQADKLKETSTPADIAGKDVNSDEQKELGRKLRPRSTTTFAYQAFTSDDYADDDFIPEEYEDSEDSSDNGLSTSLLKISKEFQHSCEYCMKTFATLVTLSYHKRNHQVCNVCKTVFSSKPKCIQHVNEVCYKKIVDNQPRVLLEKCVVPSDDEDISSSDEQDMPMRNFTEAVNSDGKTESEVVTEADESPQEIIKSSEAENFKSIASSPVVSDVICLSDEEHDDTLTKPDTTLSKVDDTLTKVDDTLTKVDDTLTKHDYTLTKQELAYMLSTFCKYTETRNYVVKKVKENQIIVQDLYPLLKSFRLPVVFSRTTRDMSAIMVRDKRTKPEMNTINLWPTDTIIDMADSNSPKKATSNCPSTNTTVVQLGNDKTSSQKKTLTNQEQVGYKSAPSAVTLNIDISEGTINQAKAYYKQVGTSITQASPNTEIANNQPNKNAINDPSTSNQSNVNNQTITDQQTNGPAYNLNGKKILLMKTMIKSQMELNAKVSSIRRGTPEEPLLLNTQFAFENSIPFRDPTIDQPKQYGPGKTAQRNRAIAPNLPGNKRNDLSKPVANKTPPHDVTLPANAYGPVVSNEVILSNVLMTPSVMSSTQPTTIYMPPIHLTVPNLEMNPNEKLLQNIDEIVQNNEKVLQRNSVTYSRRRSNKMTHHIPILPKNTENNVLPNTLCTTNSQQNTKTSTTQAVPIYGRVNVIQNPPTVNNVNNSDNLNQPQAVDYSDLMKHLVVPSAVEQVTNFTVCNSQDQPAQSNNNRNRTVGKYLRIKTPGELNKM